MLRSVLCAKAYNTKGGTRLLDAVPMLRQTNLWSHFSRSQSHPHDQTARKRGRTTEELQEQYASKLSNFKRVRTSYNDEERKVLGEVIVSCEYNCRKAMRVLQQSNLKVGYATLWRICREMEGNRLRRKRGRPVDDDFERAVLTKVIVQVLDKGLNQDGSILGNIMHSLQVIVIAGRHTVEQEPFCHREHLKRLKFSNTWAAAVLRRHRLCKRRVTSSQSNEKVPTPDEIRSTQRGIQFRLDRDNRQPADIISADETGINYCVKEKFVYCPAGSERSFAEGDDKVRITGMLAGTAAAETLPSHQIVRCSCEDDGQQQNMRVLKDLLPKLPATEHWEWKEWSGHFKFDIDKDYKTYNRQYLINDSGHIITAQGKAWMDSAGLMMWLQLVVVPWAERNNRRPVIVWDNFTPHKTVARIIGEGQWQPPAELNLAFEQLPPNCTKWLQVMDLCINAVIKSAMRRMRLSHLYSYFQDWRYEYSQALHKPPDDRPKFAPSKIALHQGITWFLAACTESFSSSKVRQGMVRCFTKVGLLRDNLNYFQLYPLQHPSSYSKWVESLMLDALVPTYADECERFHFTELFDELEFVTDMPNDDTGTDVVPVGVLYQ